MSVVVYVVFKQKTAYEMRISDWSSDVCSSDLVLPAGLEAAGGRVTHFGMPVDPGNLMLMGELDGRPAVGLPGCARSPKTNGFDQVLPRLVAGLAVSPQDVMRLGAGGLLKEIPSRPLPRSEEHTSELQSLIRHSY